MNCIYSTCAGHIEARARGEGEKGGVIISDIKFVVASFPCAAVVACVLGVFVC